MAEPKTKRTDASVADFVAGVEPERRRHDAERLLELFGEVTGVEPAMWGDGLVGYGAYDYRYASGNTGTWFRVGFAPRSARSTVYLMIGFEDLTDQLERLGKHRRGKSCLHLTRLDDVDLDVLAEMVRVAWTSPGPAEVDAG